MRVHFFLRELSSVHLPGCGDYASRVPRGLENLANSREDSRVPVDMGTFTEAEEVGPTARVAGKTGTGLASSFSMSFLTAPTTARPNKCLIFRA